MLCAAERKPIGAWLLGLLATRMALSSPQLGATGDGDVESWGTSGEVLLPCLRPVAEGDTASLSDEVESVFGTAQEAVVPFMWVFPVFEWDDGAVSEADEADEDEFTLQEQDISRMLPPANPGGRESELEVNAVLQQALLAELRPLSPASPRTSPRFPQIGIAPMSPTRVSDRGPASSLRTGASPRFPQIGIAPMSPTRASDRGPVWRTLSQTLASPPGHSPRTLVSMVVAAPASSAQQALTTPSTTSVGLVPEQVPRQLPSDDFASDVDDDGDDGNASLGDTARTSSVYALHDSGGSHTVFSDSLQLDFDQLIALGRAPTRHRLSDDEARALPRVRFEARDMQSCSICLEVFRHGMLLTGLLCGHVFHVDCLAQWVQQSSSCPNCRQDIEPLSRPPQR